MKPFIKQLIASLLCFLLLLPALVSCKGNKEREVTPDGIVLLREPVTVAGGENGNFTVVKPDISTDVYSACVSELVNVADGFSLTYASAKEADNNADTYEILIGNTCRTQSGNALNAIGYDDFSITYTDHKIVVAAHNPQRLQEAVTFLKEKLLQVKDGKLQYIGDYLYESSDALLIEGSDSLADYKIVCGDPDNLYAAAVTVKQAAKQNYGVDLEIVLPNQPQTDKEIVIGAPRQGMTASTDTLSLGEGLVAVEGKSLLITAKDILTTTQTAQAFVDAYMSGIYSDRFNLKADFSTKKNVYADQFKDTPALSDVADLRVMSFNLLVDIWKDTPIVKGRDTTVTQTILYYTPDVIGLQEASATWHKNLKLYLSGTPYRLICTERTVSHEKYGNHNFNPILYNSDALTLLDSGVKDYENKTNQYMRTISWALFEVKATGEKFVHLNTHLDAPGNTEEEKAENLEARKKQSVELMHFKSELEALYHCPVLATGDFNTTEGSDKTNKHLPYWSIIDNGMHDAKFSAERIQRQCATWHTFGSQVSTAQAGSFDHIFGNDLVKFTYFNTLVDKILMSASDHCPIYADVIFK